VAGGNLMTQVGDMNATSAAENVTAAEYGDIQAILRSGFGDLEGCSYLLLRVTEPAIARAWLRRQRPTSVADLEGGHLDQVLQIAFTAKGLRALGCDEAVLAGFSVEFLAGMADDPSRSARLGDIGSNAPQHWQWGAGESEPHIMVTVIAAANRIDVLTQHLATEIAAAGMQQISRLVTSDMKGREPFGFMDGISQPVLDWKGQYLAAAASDPAADMAFRNYMAWGEMLLGYRNEYGLFTERPLLDPTDSTALLPVAADNPARRDLGRNGTYLVLRQLSQDVRGFWRWVHQVAGAGDAVQLAEAMVGRQRSGEPLAGIEISDVPGIDGAARPRNNFTYGRDRDGHHCPFGGHIRRANPRTGDFPGGRQGLIGKLIATLGLSGTAEDDTIASTRFHRLMRRGREYGRWLDPAEAALPEAPDPQSGLHFICLNANIARQFEFVQGAWLANAKFAGLSNESDPLLGNREPFPPGQRTDRFTRPSAEGPCRLMQPLPQFVQVRGGAYFFLPGLRALSWLTRD